MAIPAPSRVTRAVLPSSEEGTADSYIPLHDHAFVRGKEATILPLWCICAMHILIYVFEWQTLLYSPHT